MDSAEHSGTDGTARQGRRTRYALVGTGNRCEMYLHALAGRRTPTSPSWWRWATPTPGGPSTTAGSQRRPRASGSASCDPAELTRTIREQGIDRVIITTPDLTHADYICQTLRAGARRRRREAPDRGRRGLPPDHRGRRGDRPPRRRHLQLPVLPAQHRAQGRRAVRGDRRRSPPWTSAGCSTPCTAPTTSAAGTGRRRTPAGCWSTSPPTTSTWSTGGSADTPERVFASGGLRFYGPGQRRGPGAPRARPRTGRRRGATPSPWTCAPTSGCSRLYLDHRAPRRLPPGPGRLLRRDHHRGQPGPRGRLRPRRHPVLLPQRALPLGGLPGRGQRHRGPGRAGGRRTGGGPAGERRLPGGPLGHGGPPPGRCPQPRRAPDRPAPLGRRRGGRHRQRGGRPRRRGPAAAGRRLPRPRRGPVRAALPATGTAWRRWPWASPATAPSSPGCPSGSPSWTWGRPAAGEPERGPGMSRVLVTGGAGRLGRSVVAGLADGRLRRPQRRPVPARGPRRLRPRRGAPRPELTDPAPCTR